MLTQAGDNVRVIGIQGNFDDAQRGVKELFGDTALEEELQRKGYVFSSANSINWGRLVPQIVYYFSAYSDAVANGRIKAGEKINLLCRPAISVISWPAIMPSLWDCRWQSLSALPTAIMF